VWRNQQTRTVWGRVSHTEVRVRTPSPSRYTGGMVTTSDGKGTPMVDTSLHDALKKALAIATAPTIDLSGNADISIGWSADLRTVYADNVPGRAYLRGMPTIIPVATLEHMRKKPPKENRLIVVQRRSHLIYQAIQSPTLVYAPDEYKKEGGFFRQACAACDAINPNSWLLVVLSRLFLSEGEALTT